MRKIKKQLFWFITTLRTEIMAWFNYINLHWNKGHGFCRSYLNPGSSLSPFNVWSCISDSSGSRECSKYKIESLKQNESKYIFSCSPWKHLRIYYSGPFFHPMKMGTFSVGFFPLRKISITYNTINTIPVNCLWYGHTAQNISDTEEMRL